MDEKTLHKLEFNVIREMLAQKTSFAGGLDKALHLLPQDTLQVVNQRLDETGEGMEVLRLGEPSYFEGLGLLQKQMAKARAGGMLLPTELREVYANLRAARLASRDVDPKKFPQLGSLTRRLTENPELEKNIDKAISPDGEVNDNASPALREIRKKISTFRHRVKDYLQDFIRSADTQKYLQDALVTDRDGRYVIPVKQEYRSDVKGIIHDESASGATVFIEPLAVVEYNNRIRSLQSEEKREVERILRELTRRVAVFTTEIEENEAVLAELDLIFARARLAYNMDAYRPEVNQRGIVEIRRARHPLLGERAIPINMELGKKFDTLVITGPNTGGKTVVLKTVGLLTVMAMSGLYIPARENSQVAIFPFIFVDIGDEQSIEQSLSTFSSHMKNIITILDQAADRSLVLLDELGAGTDPVEGAALARVILEELRRKKARVMVTTHQSELKNYAYQHERVENASVEFDPVNLRPTYELTIGMPGQSNAFSIAERLGLDRAMVERARRLVPQNEMEVGNMIRQLKENRYELQEASQEVETLRAELEQEREALKSEKAAYQREHQALMDKTRQEADQYLREIKRQAQEAVDELREMLKEKAAPPKWHEIEASRQKLKNIEQMPSPAQKGRGISSELSPGDHVYIRTIKQKGYVLEGPNNQGEVLVQVGILKISIKKDDLIRSESPEEKVYKQRQQSFLEKAKNISKEIDVRGRTGEEALLEIDRYLDDANLVGLDSVRIIHGKGTGALRTAVRGYLQENRYVKNFRDGLPEEGGFGVTIVQLA
jgi:DNA mismatch repair protein MutS2